MGELQHEAFQFAFNGWRAGGSMRLTRVRGVPCAGQNMSAADIRALNALAIQ